MHMTVLRCTWLLRDISGRPHNCYEVATTFAKISLHGSYGTVLCEAVTAALGLAK